MYIKVKVIKISCFQKVKRVISILKHLRNLISFKFAWNIKEKVYQNITKWNVGLLSLQCNLKIAANTKQQQKQQ